MYGRMYRIDNLNVFIDLSTHCNAGCPQCHRTDPNGLGKAEWLPLIQWSIDDFKQAFPPHVLDVCNVLNICGTWGDPLMNKDIGKIIDYIVDQSDCKITIDTNGSIRDEQWWWELGVRSGKQLEVTFAVDGTTQEMHQRYRRYTDLNTVLSNMKALSETEAQAGAVTIQFKHNQDHITAIKQLCEDNGARFYKIVQSDRFYVQEKLHDSFKFINEHGEADQLDRATIDPPNSHVAGTGGKRNLSNQITCRWKFDNKVLVNIDGQVLPCCYIGNNYWARKIASKGYEEFYNNSVIKQYYATQDAHNVFKNSLIEILSNSKWFNHTLPNSWQDAKTTVRQCTKHCSGLIKTKQQLKGHIND